jgi:serine O-acetyltransferase
MTLLETLRLIRSDYRAYLRTYRKRHTMVSLVNFSLYPGLIGSSLHRIAHWVNGWGGAFRLFSRLIYLVNHAVTGVDINPAAEIGEGFLMLHTSGNVVTAKLGRNVTLTVGVKIGGGFDQTDVGAGPGLPVVGDNVLFGPGCTVLGPIRIGDGAYVMPQTLVTSDVPERARAFGVPARIISRDFKHPLYKEET